MKILKILKLKIKNTLKRKQKTIIFYYDGNKKKSYIPKSK